jgi:hypothetical protein
MEKMKVLICPYCGEAQPAGERCRACGGLFEPLSRQATHNAMGPWFVRDPGKPFHPGCSYETLVKMIDRGQVTKTSVVRGPTTKQYWTVARRVPGVAHLLGYCPACDASVDPEDHGCHVCGESFGAYLDRNYLGLPEIRPLPWEARIEERSLEAPPSFSVETSDRDVAGRGISHFASDDELLDRGGGAGSPAAGAASAPIRQWARPSPVPVVAAHAPAAGTAVGDARPTVFDESTSAVVTRALRRRLASQQRTIRVMVVLLVVGLAVVLFSNLNTLAKLVGGGGSSTQTQPAPAGSTALADDMGPAGAIEELDASISDQHPSGEIPGAPDAAARPGVGPVAAPPGEAAAEGAASSPEAAILAAYGKALELIAAAAEADRSVDERIRDYEQALESLQSLGGSPPSDQQPAELTDLIERVERELERLKLKEFFG